MTEVKCLVFTILINFLSARARVRTLGAMSMALTMLRLHTMQEVTEERTCLR
jgi:hypothetical protein